MSHHATRNTRWLLGVAALGVLATGGAVAYAFNTFFQRPGESAIRLVPANAMMVATVDLSPSPRQTLVFKRIDDALTRNGLDKDLDGSIVDMLSQGKAAQAIRGYTQRSGAVAVMAPAEEGTEPMVVGFIGLTDPNAVRAALRKTAQPSFWRGTQSWKLDSSFVSVIDNYLVVTGDPKHTHEIDLVAQGAPSLLSNPQFVQARKEVDADANMMLMISPKFMDMVGKDMALPKDTKVMTDWMAMSIALRDGGIGLVASGKIDGKEIPGYLKFASIPVIRQDLMEVLPAGAYGIFAASAPASFFDMVEELYAKDQGYKDGLAEFEKEMADNMNLDLRKDVVESMRGNTVFAAYPSPGEKGGIDVLALMDDREGSKPSGTVRKMLERMNQEAQKEGGPAIFVESKEGEDTIFEISGEPAEELRKELAPDDEMLKGELLGKDKTVAVALVGDSVLAASNKTLLKQAIQSLRSKKGSLAEEGMFNGVPMQSQQLIAFHLGRIAEGVASTVNVDKMDARGQQQMKDVLGMFGSMKEPMYMQALSRSDSFSSAFFMPMDYDKLIDFIGAEVKASKK